MKISHGYKKLIAHMTPKDLCAAVLEQRPTRVDRPAVFDNPVRLNATLYEEIDTLSYSMTYLRHIEDRIRRARDERMDASRLKEVTVEQFSRMLQFMCDDHVGTPDGPRSAAVCVRKGLCQHGLHFLPPEQRPCKGEGAYIAWILQQFDLLGMSVHHVSIGLRMLMAVLTTYTSDDGGVQLFFTGVPSEGKTFTVDTIMRRVIPSMAGISTLSSRALDSAAAACLLRYNVVAIDDVPRRFFAKMPQELKHLTGRQTSVGRLVNTQGRADSHHCGVTVSPAAVVATSNFLLKDIVEAAEKGSVGHSAFCSRFYNFSLPVASLGLPGVTAQPRDGAETEDKKASALRFFYACCTVVAVCVSAKIIATPVLHDEHTSLVRDISDGFRRVCPAFKSADNRSAMHMISLSIASAIMEQVFERVVMGGKHHMGAEVRDFCDVLYDIARSLVPTEKNIVFGVSLVSFLPELEVEVRKCNCNCE